MTAFVEECRREWKRLGVPELLAEEMATELESDLAEAQADGVSATEILGESDPRRFAATWASERGLVPEQTPRKSRKRLWIWIAVAFVLVVFVLLPSLALIGSSGGSVSSGPIRVTPAQRVRVPNLVGKKACKAKRVALAAGLKVRGVPKVRCNARVIAQRPAPGSTVAVRAPRNTVTLRLRRS
jgi:hypothetical protein